MDLSTKNILLIGDQQSLVTSVAQSLRQAGANIIPAHLLDLTDLVIIQKQLVSLGTINSAILCPSWYKIDDFLNTSSTDWDEALEQNFEHMVFAMQAIAKTMIAQQRSGSIVILSSVASTMPFARTSAVGTSLSALWAVAKMAAVDLAPYNITVNIAALGWLGADWQQPFLHETGREYIQQGIPLGHVGTPSDVDGLCCFLCSDLARYITGTVIPVDGGYTLTQSSGSSPYRTT